MKQHEIDWNDLKEIPWEKPSTDWLESEYRISQSLSLLLKIIGRQHGCISRDQAREFLTKHQWDWLVESSLFVRLQPSVFALTGSPNSWMRKAWAADLSSYNCVLSHETAARIWGIHLFDSPDLPIHLTVPKDGPRKRPGVIIHRNMHIAKFDFSQIHPSGLCVTTPERTLIDLAERHKFGMLAASVHTMCNLKLTNIESIQECICETAFGRQKGIGKLKRIIDQMKMDPELVESDLERYAIRKMRRRIATTPEVQVPIYTRSGQFRMDIAFVNERIDVEIDGPHHRRAEQAAKDRKRDTAISASGWLVMRCSDLDDLDEFIDRLVEILRFRQNKSAS